MKKLAEVKRVFDRFAVDGMLTAYEALQALTEAGCTAPRTHAGRYLRSRRFFGLRREVCTHCLFSLEPRCLSATLAGMCIVRQGCVLCGSIVIIENERGKHATAGSDDEPLPNAYRGSPGTFAIARGLERLVFRFDRYSSSIPG